MKQAPLCPLPQAASPVPRAGSLLRVCHREYPRTQALPLPGDLHDGQDAGARGHRDDVGGSPILD